MCNRCEDLREGREIEKELRAAASEQGKRDFLAGRNINSSNVPWWDSRQGGWRTAAREAGLLETLVRQGVQQCC